jgi:hypothetical protein
MEGQEIYIYMLITYNDPSNQGRPYCNEFWIKWRTGEPKASHMTSQDKLSLDPYVKNLYREEKNTCKSP